MHVETSKNQPGIFSKIIIEDCSSLAETPYNTTYHLVFPSDVHHAKHFRAISSLNPVTWILLFCFSGGELEA